MCESNFLSFWRSTFDTDLNAKVIVYNTWIKGMNFQTNYIYILLLIENEINMIIAKVFL